MMAFPKTVTDHTTETLRRLARAVRSEADGIEAKHNKERGGVLRDARPDDPDYQRGCMDGLRQAADLLDDGAK